jgi:hypothetical protein
VVDVTAFEVRSFDGTHGSHAKHADALTEALAVAAAGERFVVIYHSRGLGAYELVPYCPGAGDAIAPNGGRACGRGDIGDGWYCPVHLAGHHPDSESVPCPLCHAGPGADCLVTAGGSVWIGPAGRPKPMLWCHDERHQAAIAADGRTCADTPAPAEVVMACQTTLF